MTEHKRWFRVQPIGRVERSDHAGPDDRSRTLVGMPDAACRESRDRVRAAVMSCDVEWPNQCITVNLAPAWVRTGWPSRASSTT